jgi:hypothetical protein
MRQGKRLSGRGNRTSLAWLELPSVLASFGDSFGFSGCFRLGQLFAVRRGDEVISGALQTISWCPAGGRQGGQIRKPKPTRAWNLEVQKTNRETNPNARNPDFRSGGRRICPVLLLARQARNAISSGRRSGCGFSSCWLRSSSRPLWLCETTFLRGAGQQSPVPTCKSVSHRVLPSSGGDTEKAGIVRNPLDGP